MAEKTRKEVLKAIKASAVTERIAEEYAANMLSQSLFAPIFRHILSQKNTGGLTEEAAEVYSDDKLVASTSEILSGYYHRLVVGEDTLSVVIRNLSKSKGYSDPLAFAIGYSTPQTEEPPDLKSLHKRYNKVALALIQSGDLSVFGHIGGSPVNGGVDRYTGGLEKPLVTVAQLTNWWFLRPKHEDAIGTFQKVKEYIETINPGTAKENDKLILDQAAEDMIGAKVLAGMWGENAKEIFTIWNESKPVEARPLGTREKVIEVMGLDQTSVDHVTNLGSTLQTFVGNFYDEATAAKDLESAIKSAAFLLKGLIFLNEKYEKKLSEFKERGAKIRSLMLEIEELKTTVGRLSAQVTNPGEKPVTITKKLETPRLGRDAAALIFQHTHPEILTQVFSKETVDHFDSIASNLFTEQEQEKDETLLVVSSSSSITTGEINRWLL
jgi:hypothetical protein